VTVGSTTQHQSTPGLQQAGPTTPGLQLPAALGQRSAAELRSTSTRFSFSLTTQAVYVALGLAGLILVVVIATSVYSSLRRRDSRTLSHGTKHVFLWDESSGIQCSADESSGDESTG